MLNILIYFSSPHSCSQPEVFSSLQHCFIVALKFAPFSADAFFPEEIAIVRGKIYFVTLNSGIWECVRGDLICCWKGHVFEIVNVNRLVCFYLRPMAQVYKWIFNSEHCSKIKYIWKKKIWHNEDRNKAHIKRNLRAQRLINLEIPVLVRSPKSRNVELG